MTDPEEIQFRNRHVVIPEEWEPWRRRVVELCSDNHRVPETETELWNMWSEGLEPEEAVQECKEVQP